jgi:hypothetical protein
MILEDELLALYFDGASTMLGRKSDISARLRPLFLGFPVWHCSKRRNQLKFNDATKIH